MFMVLFILFSLSYGQDFNGKNEIYLSSYRSISYDEAVEIKIIHDSTNDTVRTDLEEYIWYARKISDEGADVVIFSEYNLGQLCIDPKHYAIEVSEENVVIKELGKIAKDNKMYMVVNVFEKNITDNHQIKYYNTILVFDRTGHIITKYRKKNISICEKARGIEPGNKTLVTFTAEFGADFALTFFSEQSVWYEHDNYKKVAKVLYPVPWTTPYVASGIYYSDDQFLTLGILWENDKLVTVFRLPEEKKTNNLNVVIRNPECGLVLDRRAQHVTVQPFEGHCSQLWNFKYSQSGACFIINKETGNAITFNEDGSEKRQWYINQNKTITSANGSGALDIAEGKCEKGNKVIIFEAHGKENQLFDVIPC